MENEKEMEDSQTSEEDTAEDSQQEDHTSEKVESKPQYTDREKQLFERAKKAEAKAKRLEHLESKTQEAKEDPSSSVEDVAKTVHALKDYSPEEVDLIFRQSKALGISPSEAAKNEDVDLLIKAKRDKVEKDNKTPEPTSRQSAEGKPYNQWDTKDIENASLDEVTKFYDYLKGQG